MSKSVFTRQFSLTPVLLPVLLIVLGLSTFLVISQPTSLSSKAATDNNVYGFKDVNYTCSDGYQGLLSDNTCQTQQSLADKAGVLCASRSHCLTGDANCSKITLQKSSFTDICQY